MADQVDEKSNTFKLALYEALRIWPVLTLARQEQFGGRNTNLKENWLFESVLQIFQENEEVYPDELESFLSEALYNEFHTIVEDGSIEEVSTKICQFYKLCRVDKCDQVMVEVKKMQSYQTTVNAFKENNADGSSSEEEKEEEDATHKCDVVMTEQTDGNFGEDGWQMVRRKKR